MLSVFRAPRSIRTEISEHNLYLFTCLQKNKLELTSGRKESKKRIQKKSEYKRQQEQL
jgi:hypothetical protein